MVTQQTLSFEHPLNERTRTFLRAEHLFQLAKYRFNHLESIWDTRDCVGTIIELFNLVERTEFRNELSKELERHTNGLQRLEKTPAVDHRALDKVLKDLERSLEVLKGYSSKIGLFPQHCELLNGVRQRLLIPGGTCSFDLPAYHYWLNLPARNRQVSLNQWIEVLNPLEKALNLVLDLTRQSSIPTKEIASGGTYQKTLSQQVNCQLIRVKLRSELGVYPEISANKHRINIRFLFANFEQGKPAFAAQDIPFELTCSIIM